MKITHKTKVVAAFTTVFVVLAYSAYINITDAKELRQFGLYTVATTLQFSLSKDGRQVKYEYSVNGQKYTSFTLYVYNAKVPGGRYLLKFSSRDPSINEIYLNKPVHEELVPPEGGWTRNQLNKN